MNSPSFTNQQLHDFTSLEIFRNFKEHFKTY